MICPKCGSNMSDKKKHCDRCGEDLTLYKKIQRASNAYYNNGLARAKVRDLTGAVNALRNSLKLNKMNTNARNLLGLVYYEMGETVAALSEWVISKHFQAETNDADDYINAVQSNPTKLDSLNQAIKRYNNALVSAKQGSGDLAIIQLKKVVTLNPHFIRAYQLLALLYMKNGEKDKAVRTLYKALKIDVSNTASLFYLKEFETPSSIARETENDHEAEQGKTAIVPTTSYKEDKPNIMAYVNLIIGIIIGITVMAILIVPSIEKKYKEKENKDYIEYSSGLSVIEKKEETINQLQKEKEDLNKTIADLRAEIDSTVIPEVNPKLYDPLFKAAEQYMTELNKAKKDRDLVAVAETLSMINTKDFETDEATKLWTIIKDASYSMASDSYFQIGRDQYNTGKYDDALKNLEKSLSFNQKNVDAIYFLARTYQKMDNKQQAYFYYNMLIEQYPDTDRADQAKDYIDEVK